MNRTFWRIALWMCLIAEGVWFFIAFNLAPAPYPYQLWLMLLLWFLIVVCMLTLDQKPVIAFLAACINLVGCALLKSRPGGVAHPWLWFAYYHSVDVLIVIAAFAIWQQRIRFSRQQVRHL
jgi:hypothetical protein